MSTPAKELHLQSSEDSVTQGRQQLAEWERAQPENYYTTDRHLRDVLAFYWGDEKLRRHDARLIKFGHEAATIVDQAVRRANETHNLPRLERYNAVGERVEEVIHSADHHLAGKYIYGSGAMSVYAEPGNSVLALALFYLSSYNGEAGHNCPLACTAGVIKTLQQVGSDELRAKYLPRLLDENYETRLHGAQFLTEVQGGSDVGANACMATPLDAIRNLWLINGEKWFCSNVTADLALLTARPMGAANGTKGLGLFLVPRKLDDGQPNGTYIRRLKDKLGTKSLATAEVDFRDCMAYQIGEPGRGFQQAMDYVINTSRLYNAVGSTGAARRAYVIAWTYAQHRQAFGQPISQFPLVQETLAEMRCDVMAMTSGTFYLAHLRDLIELGQANETDRQFFRFAVNLNKYHTSVAATELIRRGIEVLGGNGAMENFSVLPRLLRDCVIFEAWEGAHGTLLAQAARDVQRQGLHEPFCTRLAELFGALESTAFGELREKGLARVATLRADLEALNEQDELAAGVCLRVLAERALWLFNAACLAREAEWAKEQKRALDKRVVTEWFWQRRVEGKRRKLPAGYMQQIAEISAEI
jgi:acyl-CoA dehydrogenase